MCEGNVLSEKLLQIILGDALTEQKRADMCKEVSHLVNGYIDSIIEGLAKRRQKLWLNKSNDLSRSNFANDESNKMKERYMKQHKPNIVGMTC